jgi:capsular polysaccharide biosynthesis protein
MLDVVRRSWPLVLFWAVLGALVLNSVAFFVPRQYSAVSQVLLIARDRNGVDPYTQAKSAERIGENLARVMQTSDFFDKVMALPETSFDKNVWKNLDERAERRKWQRDVKAVVVYNTSLLKITTHAASKEEVVRLSNAIAQTLTAHGWEYMVVTLF